MASEYYGTLTERAPIVDMACVAELDPLGLDPVMPQLARFNQDVDREGLAAVAYSAVEASRHLPEVTPDEASASLRDLSMLAMSLQRHGVDPMTTVDGLDEEMVRLGTVTYTVPIMTVATYAAGNPRGERERTFTGTDAERAFIEDLRHSYTPLAEATAALSQVVLTDVGQLCESLKLAETATAAMAESMLNSRKRIPFDMFTNSIRPYFEPVTVGGRTYHAANGAQLPLTALEPMLFGHDDPARERFFAENVDYLTADQREQLHRFEMANAGQPVISSDDFRVQERLRPIIEHLYVFRGRHLVVAQGNFAMRAAGVRGSGSFGVDDVEEVFRESVARRAGN